MIRNASILLVSILALVFHVSSASADNHWSSVASGCYISPTYAANANVDATTGAVSFATNATGTIKMTCPVTAWFEDDAEAADPDTFYGVFTDSDGRSTNTCQVWFELLRDNTTGTSGVTAITGIDNVGGGNYTQYGTTTSRQRTEDPFTHSWDSSSYHYWVIIEMSRANLVNGCNITVFGTGLFHTVG
jgi:hypothetical protein